MSIICVSPTDIVGGAKVVLRAASAFSSEDGARAQFQKVKQSRDDYQKAVTALSDQCASSTVNGAADLTETLGHLSDHHKGRQQQLHTFEHHLGPKSSGKRHAGAKQKLQWTFKNGKEEQDWDNRAALSAGAALLQAIRYQNDVEEAHFAASQDQISASSNAAVAEIMPRLDDLKTQNAILHDKLIAHNDAQTQAFISRVDTALSRSDTAIQKAIEAAMLKAVTIVAGSSPPPTPRLQKTRKKLGRTRNLPIATAQTAHATPRGLSQDSCLKLLSRATTEKTRLIATVLITLLYASPETRKLSIRLWKSAQSDPVLSFLALLCIVVFQQWLSTLSKPISLLSDNSLALEDPFGGELRVPFVYAEQFEYFHGFLEYYFRQRPGLVYVQKKHYRLYLGNTRGHVVDSAGWSAMVKPRGRLTMSMLVASSIGRCIKCCSWKKLHVVRALQQCLSCGQEYNSVSYSNSQNVDAKPTTTRRKEISGRPPGDDTPPLLTTRDRFGSWRTGLVPEVRENAKKQAGSEDLPFFKHMALQVDTAGIPPPHLFFRRVLSSLACPRRIYIGCDTMLELVQDYPEFCRKKRVSQELALVAWLVARYIVDPHDGRWFQHLWNQGIVSGRAIDALDLLRPAHYRDPRWPPSTWPTGYTYDESGVRVFNGAGSDDGWLGMLPFMQSLGILLTEIYLVRPLELDVVARFGSSQTMSQYLEVARQLLDMHVGDGRMSSDYYEAVRFCLNPVQVGQETWSEAYKQRVVTRLHRNYFEVAA